MKRMGIIPNFYCQIFCLTYHRFYYDAISWGGPWSQQLPVRSLVGLIPLYAVLTLEPELIEKFPSFKKRVDWLDRKSVV